MKYLEGLFVVFKYLLKTPYKDDEGLLNAWVRNIATPGEWESSKGNFNRVFQVWVSVIILIAAPNSIPSGAAIFILFDFNKFNFRTFSK